jgi:hypothetical protein
MAVRQTNATKILIGAAAALLLLVGAWTWNLTRRTPLSTREANSCGVTRSLLVPSAHLLSRATSANLAHDAQARSIVQFLEWTSPTTNLPRSIAPSFAALYAYTDGIGSGRRPSETVRLNAVAAVEPIEHWARTCRPSR